MSFSLSLSLADRNRLRAVVRKVHLRHVGEKHGQSFLTNAMCDNLIDNLGPEVQQKMLKHLVDKNLA